MSVLMTSWAPTNKGCWKLKMSVAITWHGWVHVKPHPLNLKKWEEHHPTRLLPAQLHWKRPTKTSSLCKHNGQADWKTNEWQGSYSIAFHFNVPINAQRCKVFIVCIWQLLSCNCKELVALGSVPSPPFACQHHHALYLPEIIKVFAVHQVTSLRSFFLCWFFRISWGKKQSLIRPTLSHLSVDLCDLLQLGETWCEKDWDQV